jgi:glycosyltransferase involved in cell wall biosynthesis
MPLPRYKVAWLTGHPCPLQRPLLEAIARRPEVELTVILCHPSAASSRTWDWKEEIGAYSHRLMTGFTWGQYFFNPQIVRLCLEENYDLFMVSSYAQPTMQLAMLTLTLAGRRWALIGERPGMSPNSLIRNALRAVALTLPRHFAAAAIGTGSLATHAFQRLFGDSRPVRSIPYLINLDPFVSLPFPPLRRDVRVRFLFSGQLIPRKGIKLLAEAAAKLLEVNAPLQLMIVGDGPERAMLEAVRGRFPDSVKLYGFLPFEQRMNAYTDADVFVFPSLHDGWGVAVHEAMARGLPVIGSSAAASVVDLVQSGVNGFTVDAGSVDQLVRAMQFFIEDQDAITQFGRKARAAAQQLTPEWGASQLVALVAGACSPPIGQLDQLAS